MRTKLVLKHREDGWWIMKKPNELLCGPYEKRSDASSDKEGLLKFYREYEELFDD